MLMSVSSMALPRYSTRLRFNVSTPPTWLAARLINDSRMPLTADSSSSRCSPSGTVTSWPCRSTLKVGSPDGVLMGHQELSAKVERGLENCGSMARRESHPPPSHTDLLA